LILVDSSVWIDAIRGKQEPQCETLAELLARGEVVCLNSLILTEVLRGSHSDDELNHVARQLRRLPFLELDAPHDHIQASRLYRSARASGVTVSGVADLLIAATCIEFEATLLHNDRDFDNLATVSDLKVWRPAG